MFNDASFAKLLYSSITIQCYRRVLNVELLQPTAIVGHALYA